MERDIRATSLYREISRFCSDVRQPGTKQLSDAAQLQASPDGGHVVFAGTIAERVEEEPPTRVTLTELATGITQVLSAGPNTDKSPRFSPDGRAIAFLSDRLTVNSFQLHLLDRESGAVRETRNVAGSVEHLQWSADGTRILLGVVGPDAAEPGVPSWMPSVDPAEEDRERRGCWIYEVASGSVRPVATDCNTWEASWYGTESLVVVASQRPGEGYWYSASLRIIDIKTGKDREIYRPAEQLGSPVVSPGDKTIAIIEGLCSDRGPVAGDLRLIDPASGNCRKADTHGVDVLYAQWYSERYLLLSGIRGLGSVAGLYDVSTDRFSEIWSSQDVAVTRLGVSCLKTPGDCVMLTESFTQAPELIVIRDGQSRRVRSFDVGYSEATRVIAGVERITWASSDELEIQGWLLRPSGPAPHPLIMDVHGGPVGRWGPAFLIRRMLHIPILLSHGYAVFLPNPRGSSGRGQEFARKVLGDLGGEDARDLLRGLDALIERGVVDSGRIGVMGTSYGGFMAAWLIGQCTRFAAAVAVSPHTNQVTATLLSNIPQFMSRLVDDELSNAHGRYFERSPVIYARNVRTPILNICGALDRCTPAEEAAQFHNALLHNGANSVLVTYPREGHGIRKLPAMLDCATRVTAWFLQHIPAAAG